MIILPPEIGCAHPIMVSATLCLIPTVLGLRSQLALSNLALRQQMATQAE